VRGARDLLAHGPLLPELAAADLGRGLANHFAADRFLGALVVRARILVALLGDLLPLHALLAGHGVLLVDPLAALPGHGLVGRDRLAHGPLALLQAALGDFLVGRAADLLHDALGHRPAHRAADLLDAGLLDLAADGVALFAAVLLTDFLADLAALLLAV